MTSGMWVVTMIGRAGLLRGEVLGQPPELVVVDAGLVGAVGGDADGVEDDEVVALVVEGVVGGAEAVGEHLLAVVGVGGAGAAGGIDAEAVVVAEGVVDLEAEVLLGLAVLVEELGGAGLGHAEGVEDVVAALDDEVGGDLAGLAEGHVGAVDGVELGLEMGVGEEEEAEVFRGGLGQRGDRGQRGGGGCRAEQMQEVAAVEVQRRHGCMITGAG